MKEETRLVVRAFRRLNIIKTTDIKIINENLLRMKNNNENKVDNCMSPKIKNNADSNNYYHNQIHNSNIKNDSDNNDIKEITEKRILECYSKLVIIIKTLGLKIHRDAENIVDVDIRNLRYRISQMEVQLTLLTE